MNTHAPIHRRKREDEAASKAATSGKSAPADAEGLPLFMQAAASAAGATLQRQCDGASNPETHEECTSCANGTPLQAKLSIGASDDPLELEADRVADQVMAAPAHPIVNGTPPRIQRFSGHSSGQMDSAPASVDRVLASPGRPLEPALRQDMGQRFGHDFARVRVHADAAAEQSARDVNANAYTVGNDIVFGASRFAPGTHDGRRLIAHELSHVVQEGSFVSSVVRRQDQPPIPPATGRPAAMSPDELWELVLNKRGVESRVPPHAVDAAEDREGAAHSRLDNARAAHREQVAQRREAGDPDSRVGAQTRKSTRKEVRDARADVATATKRTDSARANASERMPDVDNPNEQKLGHGTQTFAAIQVTDEQGGQVALGIDSYRDRQHSEENALIQIRFNLDKVGLKASDKPGKGWRVTVVVDQTVCPDRCRPAIRRFANEYGIDPKNVVALYPQRLSGPTVTPKTASRSAHVNPVRLGDPVPILDAMPKRTPPMDAHQGTTMPKRTPPMDAHQGTTMPKRTPPMDAHQGTTMPKRTPPMDAHQGSPVPKPASPVPVRPPDSTASNRAAARNAALAEAEAQLAEMRKSVTSGAEFNKRLNVYLKVFSGMTKANAYFEAITQGLTVFAEGTSMPGPQHEADDVLKQSKDAISYARYFTRPSIDQIMKFYSQENSRALSEIAATCGGFSTEQKSRVRQLFTLATDLHEQAKQYNEGSFQSYGMSVAQTGEETASNAMNMLNGDAMKRIANALNAAGDNFATAAWMAKQSADDAERVANICNDMVVAGFHNLTPRCDFLGQDCDEERSRVEMAKQAGQTMLHGGSAQAP